MECLQSARYYMNHYLYYIEYLRFMTRKYRAGTESLKFIVLSQQLSGPTFCGSIH